MAKGYSLEKRGKQQAARRAPAKQSASRFYAPMPGTDAFWAEDIEDDQRWQSLVSMVNNTRYEQMTRYQQIIRFATMFQYGAKGFPSATPRTKTINEAELSFNRCYFVIRTILADTFTVGVTPQFFTEGGTFEEREFAEDATRAIQTVLEDCNYSWEEERCMTDALSSTGTGFLRVAPDYAQQKVVVRRMNPLDIVFDEMEARDGDPQTMLVRHSLDKGVASSSFDCDLSGMHVHGTFAEREEWLEGAESIDILSDERALRRRNRIEIWEGVHRPSRYLMPGQSSEDGMQVWACNGHTLSCNEWDSNAFDIVPMTPVASFSGLYGIPLMRFLVAPQRELEVTDLRLQRAIRRLGGVNIAVPRNAKIVARQLTNDSGTAFEYSGDVPPSGLVIPPFHDSVLQYRQMLDQDIVRFSGQNMTAATGQIPPNLTNVSGKALNTALDTGSRVNAYILRCRERSVVATTDRVLDAIAKLVEKNPKLTCRFLKGNGYKTVRWADILKRRHEMILRCKPINALSTHPTARLQQATELLATRAIDNTEWRVITRIGDVKANDMRVNSHADRIEMILDLIVAKGIYNPPEEFYNLEECLAVGTAYYQMSQVMQVKGDRLDKLRQWCTDTQMMIDKAEIDRMKKQAMMNAQMQATMGPPPGAGMGPEGGPPMPPTGGPPPAGGGAMKPIDVTAPPTMMAPGGALAA